MSFHDFCHLKSKSSTRGAMRVVSQNSELQCTLGKVTIPNFDGSSKCTARAWVQKLDIYFQVNKMVEVDAIKLAILYLDGETHE